MTSVYHYSYNVKKIFSDIDWEAFGKRTDGHLVI